MYLELDSAWKLDLCVIGSEPLQYHSSLPHRSRASCSAGAPAILAFGTSPLSLFDWRNSAPAVMLVAACLSDECLMDAISGIFGVMILKLPRTTLTAQCRF
jgi:hypothetical protein